MLRLPNSAKINWLTLVLAGHASWEVRLYDNSVSIGDSTVVGDFNQSSFAGYSAFNPVFGTIAIDGSQRAASSTTPHTFHLTSGTATVYGCYLVDAGGALMGAAAFTSPITLSLSVPDLNLTLTAQLQSPIP